jgi:hypothetical protein
MIQLGWDREMTVMVMMMMVVVVAVILVNFLFP